jgi:hypothetical protein
MNEIDTVDWGALPSRRELHRQLDRLDIAADAKVALAELTDFSAKVGEKVVEVGRRIVAFALELIRQFPNLTFCAIMAMVLTTLIAAIPLLGPPLSALLGPLLMAAGVATGSLMELADGDLRGRIALLTTEFDRILA